MTLDLTIKNTQLIIMILATALMLKNVKIRPDLKFWFVSYMLYLFASLFALLVQMGEEELVSFSVSSFRGLFIVLYALSNLFLIIGAFQLKKSAEFVSINDISLINGKSFSISSIYLLFAVNGALMGQISIQIVLLILIIYTYFITNRLFLKFRTPTYLFSSLIFVFTGMNLISTMTSSLGYNEMGYFSTVTGFIITIIYLVTSLAISIESRMNEQNKTIQKTFLTLQDQLKEKEKIAKILVETAEALSSNAEEVTSSSENIASSQQQISKGVVSQVNAINDTQKKFSTFTQGLSTTRNKAQNITEISTTIRNIANQTNMLALNAAIEAARAGEAGRGFNVVADQVRKLAEESSKAVNRSNLTINEIIEIINKQEQDALTILHNIDEIANIAEETSASTEESAAAAEEQAASMESITNSAQELVNLAKNLKKEL